MSNKRPRPPPQEEQDDDNQYSSHTHIQSAISAQRISKGANGLTILFHCPMPVLLKVAFTHGHGDNSVYEWYAGTYGINPWTKQFLCFVETIQLRLFTNSDDYTHIFAASTTDEELCHIFNRMQPIQFTHKQLSKFPHICTHNEYFAVLQAYVSNTIPVYKWLRRTPPAPNNVARLVDFLLQLTLPLAKQQVRFTHNDLHANNMLLRKLPDNNFIQIHFQYKSFVVRIVTPYILKIIDYGRCFFDSTLQTEYSSTHFWKCISHNPGCQGNPRDSGFTFWKQPSKRNTYTSQLHGNFSRDILIVTNIRDNAMDRALSIPHPILSTPFQTLLDSAPPDTYLPARRSDTCGYPICNTIDLAANLIEFYRNYEDVLHHAWSEDTDAMTTLGGECLGTYIMYMTEDQPMEFVPTPIVEGGGRGRGRGKRRPSHSAL